MVRVTVKFSSKLGALASSVQAQTAGRSPGPIRDAFKQWGWRYRGFVQERFDRFSKGGGDWPGLAASTKAGRRGKKYTILRNLGLLFNALDPTFRHAPGAVEKHVPFGVVVGYGGPHRHPGGAATIADIANFHQTGRPNLPQRKIIVRPSPQTMAGMAEDMVRAERKLIRQNKV